MLYNCFHFLAYPQWERFWSKKAVALLIQIFDVFRDEVFGEKSVSACCLVNMFFEEHHIVEVVLNEFFLLLYKKITVLVCKASKGSPGNLIFIILPF